jgi:hypothetical protein
LVKIPHRLFVDGANIVQSLHGLVNRGHRATSILPAHVLSPPQNRLFQPTPQAAFPSGENVPRGFLELLLFVGINIRSRAFGKTVDKHRALTFLKKDDGAISARFAMTRARDPLLDHAAAKVGIHLPSSARATASSRSTSALFAFLANRWNHFVLKALGLRIPNVHYNHFVVRGTRFFKGINRGVRKSGWLRLSAGMVKAGAAVNAVVSILQKGEEKREIRFSKSYGFTIEPSMPRTVVHESPGRTGCGGYLSASCWRISIPKPGSPLPYR